MINVENFIISPVSEELAKEALDVAKGLKGECPSQYKERAIKVIVEMTRINMEYHFISPLKYFNLGGIEITIAKLAISAAHQAIATFIKKGIARIDDIQLKIVADLLEETVISKKYNKKK